MAVLFYDPNDNQDLDIMDELEKIDDECRRFEIDFVKVTQFDRFSSDSIVNILILTLQLDNKFLSFL